MNLAQADGVAGKSDVRCQTDFAFIIVIAGGAV
jgi:hypothetical protein